MAKIRIPVGYSKEEIANQLAELGITLDGHQLADGTYRAYVRKRNINVFIMYLKKT
ncbi:MAG: hypothetical protein IK073_01880 [Paludibacteraceae bacterium]|nr:hypothetical protein [Paludibacteraceae bacterium]